MAETLPNDSISSWPLVVVLRHAVSPSAVFRGVAQIVVDTVNTQTGRTFAHIGKKVLKGVHPAATDSNSTPPVISKLWEALPCAAGLHIAPDVVLACTGTVVDCSCRKQFSVPVTAAGCGLTGSKVARVYRVAIAAIAKAIPADFLALVGGTTDNGERTETLASKVDQSHCIAPMQNALMGCAVVPEQGIFGATLTAPV